MKSIYLALACALLLGGAFAQSVPQTPNIHLNEPPYHYQRWDVPNNANWTLLDSFWSQILAGCGGDGSHGIGWDPVLHFQCVGIVGTNAPGGSPNQLQYNSAGGLGGFNDGTAHQVLHGLRIFSAVTGLDTDSTIAQTGADINTSFQVTSLHLSAPCSIAMGCTGTATPGLVAGSNITVTGFWPNQTITSLAGGPGGSNTQVEFNDSGTHGGNAGLTFNKTAQTLVPYYLATARGPYLDPRAFGCPSGTTGSSVTDTACWQAAEAQMHSGGGTVICSGSWKLDRVQMQNAEYYLGVGDQNGNGCLITVQTDAAFVPKTPASFLQGVTLENMQFRGGTSPIDLAAGNDLHVINMNMRDYSNCAVVYVYGERSSFVEIIGSHLNSSGFGTLCTGDKSKSLFSGSIAVTGGIARTYIHGIKDLGTLGTSGFSDQYMWWGGEGVTGGIDTTDASDFICFFSCTAGYIWMDYMHQSRLSVLDTDNVATSGSPETIGIYIQDHMYQSRIDHYDPAFNTNWMNTQIKIGQFESSTFADSNLCSGTCDNSTKFGLNLSYAATNSGVIEGVSGAVFAANPQNITIVGGQVNPTNMPGAVKLFDASNNGEYFSIGNGGSSATGLFQFCRHSGAGGWPCDFTSDGGLFKLTTDRLMVAGTVPTCTFTSGGGTTPSCSLITGSSDNAGVIQATTGTGSPAGAGTITLTFSSTFGTNRPVCQYMASEPSGVATWAALASFKDENPSTTSDVFQFTNGVTPTALTATSQYWINYQCWAK